MSANTRTLIVSGIPVHICEFMPWPEKYGMEPLRYLLVTRHGQPHELYINDEKWATEEEVSRIFAQEKEWEKTP